ncbi:MAG: hypothetical protein R3B49_06065 [Phycisphaerales bacterium]
MRISSEGMTYPMFSAVSMPLKVTPTTSLPRIIGPPELPGFNAASTCTRSPATDCE